MMATQYTQRYHRVSMVLHWLMAALIIGLIALGLVMEELTPLSLRIDAFQLHKSFGIAVLFLALLRLGWRMTHPVPPMPETMKRHEKWAAHTGHWLLYALMIIMPVSGWLMAWASKYPTVLFLISELPALPFPEMLDKDATKKIAYAVHEITTQWVAIPLIIGHILAALYHQYVQKIPLMQRMLPRRNAP
jgi:cytochrome b561